MIVKALCGLEDFVVFGKLGTLYFSKCLREIILQKLLIGTLCRLCRCILKALGYFLKIYSFNICILDIKNPFLILFLIKYFYKIKIKLKC